MTRVLVLVMTASIVGCDGRPSGTPTQPSVTTPPSNAPPSVNPLALPPPTPVRTITLKTNDGRTELDFGDVEPGSDATKTFYVCNEGNSALHVSRIEGPAGYSSSAYQEWYDGPDGDPNALLNVSPGHCWEAWSTFTPTTSGPHTGIITVIADQTSGTNTIPVRGNGVFPAVPRRVFGEGTFVVGKGIAPGRYYADPNGWCQWSRAARYPPEDTDFIAGNEPWFDSGQWIVDILPSDALFINGNGCGWWGQVPSRVARRTVIEPGMWHVGAQIEPGRFRATARPGCYWERLRHFQGTPEAITASGSLASGGDITVDIFARDVGFHANAACGPWTQE